MMDFILIIIFFSHIYWTDWGSKTIEQTALDGTHRRVVVANLGRANGLTIDYIESRLYWTDIDKYTIESADLQGIF